MRKLQALVAAAATAGTLAAGLAIAPAAQAAAPAAAQAAAPKKHFFGPYYSGFGKGETFGKRSYFKGYWYRTGGRYWFFGDLIDRDFDRQYTYVWFRWHDRFGFHTKVFRTLGKKRFIKFGGFRVGTGFDDFKIRVCEGRNQFADCGKWGDAF